MHLSSRDGGIPSILQRRASPPGPLEKRVAPLGSRERGSPRKASLTLLPAEGADLAVRRRTLRGGEEGDERSKGRPKGPAADNPPSSPLRKGCASAHGARRGPHQMPSKAFNPPSKRTRPSLRFFTFPISGKTLPSLAPALSTRSPRLAHRPITLLIDAKAPQ